MWTLRRGAWTFRDSPARCLGVVTGVFVRWHRDTVTPPEAVSELATNSASAFALLAADDLGRFEDAGHEAEMYHDMTESGVDWG